MFATGYNNKAVLNVVYHCIYEEQEGGYNISFGPKMTSSGKSNLNEGGANISSSCMMKV